MAFARISCSSLSGLLGTTRLAQALPSSRPLRTCWLMVEPRGDYVHTLVGLKGLPSPNSTRPQVRRTCVCTGEVFRRLVGKALLKIELPAFRTHLLPHLLAVGVPAGAEAMPHLLRQWKRKYAGDTDQLCLSYDQSNAHNVVDRHTLLTRMAEVAPGLGRWLEHIYPTDLPTKVFYRDVVIDSCACGQQGCPLMAACHAVAHRLLLESLGLVRPPTATAVTLPCLSPPAQLDMAPCFADDGLLAGPSAEVLRALRHLLAVMPALGLRFSSLVVAAAAGPHHQINFDPFLEAGCSDGGLEVLNSPIGSETFCADFSRKLVDKQLVAVHAVGPLPDAQVGYYLLRCSCNASRVCYLSRTTPASHCLHALGRFDTGVQVVGGGLEPLALGAGHVACEGRWPRPTTRRLSADSAYVGSHNCTFERCRALWGDYVWDADQPGTHLHGALDRCGGELRRRGILTPLEGHRPSPKLQQKALG